MKEKIRQILQGKQPKLCVLATADTSARPASAVVGYTVRDDCSILIATRPDTQKARNIRQNTKVSLVFGFSFSEPYIQLLGTAAEISGGQEKQAASEFFFSVNPEAVKFKTPDYLFFAITPTWARLIHVTQHPPLTEESAF